MRIRRHNKCSEGVEQDDDFPIGGGAIYDLWNVSGLRLYAYLAGDFHVLLVGVASSKSTYRVVYFFAWEL